MDMTFDEVDEQFRAEVRQFFAQEYPKELLARAASGYQLTKDEYQQAERALAAKGWLCVNWPAEQGGPGWNSNQKYIFDQELELAGAINPVPMEVIWPRPSSMPQLPMGYSQPPPLLATAAECRYTLSSPTKAETPCVAS